MFSGSSYLKVQEMLSEVLGFGPTLPAGAPIPRLQQLVLHYEQGNSKDALTPASGPQEMQGQPPLQLRKARMEAPSGESAS